MAVKWAVANGNWNAGATWNDGVVPVDGDEIYLNGYTINPNVNFNLRNSIIRNDANSDYNIVAGGTLNANNRTNCVFSAKKYIVSSSNFFYQVYNGGVFNGDVELLNGIFCYKTGSNQGFSWTLNGNVHRISGTNGTLFNDASFNSPSITIVGNITDEGLGGTITRSGTANLVVSGNVQWNGSLGGITTRIVGNYNIYGTNVSATTLQISGNMRITSGRVSCTTCNFGGEEILYSNTANNPGLLAQTINFINDNANTFIWKDVSEPRTNPFVVVTDAELANRQQYPAESDVRKDVEYAWGVLKGQLEQVQVGCVTKEDVREGVPLLGMGGNGTLVVPSADDVREGVVFDNGSVGTLIVEGGGDRLRIADFGYYTNAQSDTYIVDLTEQDKPKFAVAEERVLIEMFPDLDLEDIPEKYFDDFFVKFLKYRLIVEYYRTAGINSTFTTSEPTTEVVNYRNVNCEIWMNIANTYLKAWGVKYPNSIKKQRILL